VARRSLIEVLNLEHPMAEILSLHDAVGIITDLCVMEPEAGTHEFVVTTPHPGVTREQVIAATGWEVRLAEDLKDSAEPSEYELTALRDLEARTAAVHYQALGEA